jgi:hypothetical protein
MHQWSFFHIYLCPILQSISLSRLDLRSLDLKDYEQFIESTLIFNQQKLSNFYYFNIMVKQFRIHQKKKKDYAHLC